MEKVTITIKRFEEVFLNKDSLNDWVVEHVKPLYNVSQVWDNSVIDLNSLISLIFLTYKRRYLKWEEEEFKDYFIIDLVENLPTLFADCLKLQKTFFDELIGDKILKGVKSTNLSKGATSPSNVKDVGVVNDNIVLDGKLVDTYTLGISTSEVDIPVFDRIRQLSSLNFQPIFKKFINKLNHLFSFVNLADDATITINGQGLTDPQIRKMLWDFDAGNNVMQKPLQELLFYIKYLLDNSSGINTDDVRRMLFNLGADSGTIQALLDIINGNFSTINQGLLSINADLRHLEFNKNKNVKGFSPAEVWGIYDIGDEFVLDATEENYYGNPIFLKVNGKDDDKIYWTGSKLNVDNADDYIKGTINKNLPWDQQESVVKSNRKFENSDNDEFVATVFKAKQFAKEAVSSGVPSIAEGKINERFRNVGVGEVQFGRSLDDMGPADSTNPNNRLPTLLDVRGKLNIIPENSLAGIYILEKRDMNSGFVNYEKAAPLLRRTSKRITIKPSATVVNVGNIPDINLKYNEPDGTKYPHKVVDIVGQFLGVKNTEFGIFVNDGGFGYIAFNQNDKQYNSWMFDTPSQTLKWNKPVVNEWGPFRILVITVYYERDI